MADHAQHQVCGVGGQEMRSLSGWQAPRCHQSGRKVRQHRAVHGVYGNHQTVEPQKSHGAGVYFSQNTRSCHGVFPMQDHPRFGQIGFCSTPGKPSEDQQVVISGVVVMRGQLVVQQVLHMQLMQTHPQPSDHRFLNLALQQFELAPCKGHPHKALQWQTLGDGVGLVHLMRGHVENAHAYSLPQRVCRLMSHC